MDALTNFFDHLSDPAPAIPTLEDFNTSSNSEALKWTDLDQDLVYQNVSTCTVNKQHGPSIILSLQKADGSCLVLWCWTHNCLHKQQGQKRPRFEGYTIHINYCSVDDPDNCKFFMLRYIQRNFYHSSPSGTGTRKRLINIGGGLRGVCL